MTTTTANKVCEDCTEYLLCPKVSAEKDNQPICEKFVDNFPEDNEQGQE